mmetsp:Transcript_22211/g.42067  ORF Transcript_22211/g.42067 Transcript_22211/m.42067 type:complete len:121 (+) Transcript_22211:1261-1623(+)
MWELSIISFAFYFLPSSFYFCSLPNHYFPLINLNNSEEASVKPTKNFTAKNQISVRLELRWHCSRSMEGYRARVLTSRRLCILICAEGIIFAGSFLVSAEIFWQEIGNQFAPHKKKDFRG